jgi:DNA-binding SARP family transcriptional activator/predicted ATPase
MNSMSWQLKVLGEASLVRGTTLLRPERKTVGLLSYLALEGPTSRSKLAGLLWPDSEEATARNNLAQVLRRLKKATEQDFIIGSDLLSLNGLEVDAATLKVLSFEGDYSKLLEPTGALLSPHDYDDCPDFADWLFSERERIASLHREALSSEATRLGKEGNYAEAIRHLQALLQIDPLSEEIHRQLMRFYFLSGDRAAALKAFERCKEILEKELSVEPLSETRTLAAEIEFGSLLPVVTKTKAELPLHVLRPPLVGREDIWLQMDEAWRKRQAIILRGEPGVGKSRLLKDFLDSKGGYTFFEGRPGDRGVPYSTQSRILRQLLSLYPLTLGLWQRKELSRLLPELGETPEPLTSETDQLRFYEAQAAVFHHAFEEGMRFIAVDDLQFFDEASFKSLHFILSQGWGKPNALQTVLAYRLNELRIDSETLLKETVQAGSSVLLDVTGLDETHVQTFLDSLGIANLEPLQKTLHSFTGGNPLFMLETIKRMLESESATLKLPSSSKVQTLLQQRLDRLSQPALRLAWTAAVAQTDFSLELASQIMQQSPFDLAEVFGELEGRGIFTGQRFSHDLMFETALASISVPVKLYLHKQSAEVLEKQGASPGRIANHYLAANEHYKALPFLQQAADVAKRDFQLIDAALFAERVADILEAQAKPDEAFDYLKRLREWLVNSHEHEKIEQVAERMLKLAHTNIQQAESYHAQAEYLLYQKGDFIKAEEAAREGLRYATTPKERSLVLSDLGSALFFQDRLSEAVPPLREVVKLDQALQSDNLGPSLTNLSVVLQHLGEYAEVLELQEQAIAFCRHKAMQDQLAISLSNCAITLCELGYLRRSLQPLQEALKLQRTMQGIDHNLATTLLALGQSYRDLCHLKDALEALQEALAIAEQSEAILKSYIAVNLAHVYVLLGQNETAKNLLDKAMASPPDYPSIQARMFREQGRWYLEQGQYDQAKQTFEKAKKQLAQGQRKLTLDSIHLLECVMLPPKESLELAKQILEGAKEGELKGGMALGALTRCAQAALHLKQHKKALESSRAATEMLKTYDPDTFYLGEIYLAHYQALKACNDKTAKDYLQQTLAWLVKVADEHVPSEYRESFLTNTKVNKAILEAARLEGLLKPNMPVM